MKFYRKEKQLDVTDAVFESAEHLEKSIKGSIASKIGFLQLIVTAEQKTRLGLTDKYLEFEVVVEGADAKKERIKNQKARDAINNRGK